MTLFAWQCRLICALSLLILSPTKILAETDPIKFVSTLSNNEFKLLLDDFASTTGIPLETIQLDNNKLKGQLQLVDEEMTIPDAMLVPADFIGLSDIHYSEIPGSWISGDIKEKDIQTASLNGKVLGIPVISGNHLVLYYNKTKTTRPAQSWQEIVNSTKLKKGYQIGWSFNEMYWFIPFLTAFNALPYQVNSTEMQTVDFNTPQMQQALTFYWQLNSLGVVDDKCIYTCAQKRFRTGDLNYLIDGFWSYHSLKQQLGDSLGVAPLPTIDGQPMHSYFSVYLIAFPEQALSGPKQAELKRLIDYFQSYQVQSRLWNEFGLIPTHKKAFQALASMQSANVRVILNQMASSIPMPNNPEMAIIWEVLFKGFSRYGSGVMDAQRTVSYMQHIAERSLLHLK